MRLDLPQEWGGPSVLLQFGDKRDDVEGAFLVVGYVCPPKSPLSGMIIICQGVGVGCLSPPPLYTYTYAIAFSQITLQKICATFPPPHTNRWDPPGYKELERRVKEGGEVEVASRKRSGKRSG